jgi:hypothetical protein
MVRPARALLALAAIVAVATPILHTGNRLRAAPEVGTADAELVAPLRGAWAVGASFSPEADGVATRHAPKRMGAWGGAALVAALAGVLLAGRWSRNLRLSADGARRVWWRPGSLQRAPPLAPRF